MAFAKRLFVWSAMFAAGAVLAVADEPPPAADNSRPAEPALAPAAETATPSSAAPLNGLLTPKLQPQSVVITLINGNTMTGTISDADQWPMKTSFGTANVPLSAVAGIRMAQEGSATTTVALHNGDTITGAIEIDKVAIQTDWGRAEILGTHVASILFTSGLKWISEPGLNGTRWRLVAADPRTVATNAAPAPPQQPRAATFNRTGNRP